MTNLFSAFFKRHFYILGLMNFAFFMALAFSYQLGLSQNLSSLFIGTESLTNEEQELTDIVQSWQQNVMSLKSYIDSPDYLTNTKPARSNKYNEHSTRNNQLMNQALSSPLAKSPAIYNLLAQRSLNYADYFEAVKNFIASGNPVQTNLVNEPIDLFKKNVGENKFNSDSIYLVISLSSLTLALFHLLFLYSRTRKENIGLLSQVDTFKKVISNMSEGVIVTDKYGFFNFTNESAKNIIGPVVNDIFYESSVEVMGFETADGRKLTKEELPMFTALKKGLANEQEFVIKNPLHPEGIFVSTSNGYYVDDRGLTAGSVVVLKNITAKKQMEQFWKSEKERATEHSKLKSDFLASMSHEIRTPMNAVLGLTTLLKETTLNADQKDYVVTIQRSAKSLLTLINDILDHSKIEAGKLDIINAPFNLKTLAHEIADNFKPLVLEKNIELKLNFSELKTDTYNSDANRIRQIMINLIGNAIKFTKEGSVELQFVTENTNTKVIVKDTGSGMTPLEVSHLFQKYFQTKNGQTVGGTGLGLNICKQLVDLLNGEIGVSSELGKGTQFWFSLPLEHSTLVTSDTQEIDAESLLFTNQFQGLVLVAEDSIVNQKVIANYLSKLGLQSVIANNGEEAVRMYQLHHPDLILMDSNMPVMNGLEATKEIIKLQTNNPEFKQTPIVGLSADVRQANFDSNLQAGMVAFLTKPIELNKLVALLKNYFTATLASPSQIEKIKHLMVGDQLLIEILLSDFTAQAPAQIAQLSELLAAKNISGLYQVAHSLKSAAAELDAFELNQVLAKIEQLADENDSNNYDLLHKEIINAELSFTLAISSIIDRVNDIKASQRKAS